MNTLIEKVWLANPKRKKKDLDRRIMKLGEEYGEAVQAFLAVTSKNNLKGKSWDDVREEITDVIIVALDIILTEMPDEKFNKEEKLRCAEARFMAELDRKLEKWHSKISNKQTEVDDAE